MLELGAPQLIYLALTVLGLGWTMGSHGKPRCPHNAWATLIGTAIILALLWWGGFFGG